METERERERERERESERERETDRQTDRNRERKRERQTDREREREGEREITIFQLRMECFCFSFGLLGLISFPRINFQTITIKVEHVSFFFFCRTTKRHIK